MTGVRTAWRRYLAAYVSAVAIVGLPFASAGVAAYLGVGAGGLVAGLVTVPLVVFALIAAASLPYLPALIWAAGRSVGMKFLVTVLALVYAIVLYESVRAAATVVDSQTAQQFAERWEEATLGQLMVVMPPVCVLFFVLEAILKFESRQARSGGGS